MNYQVSIVEIRNIIQAVQTRYNIDFSNYALTSFKRRIETYFQENHILNSNDFISRIYEHKHVFDNFLGHVLISDTEIFRDPAYWKALKANVLPSLATADSIRIWIANTITGEELYSMCILLKEMHLLSRSRIIVTNINAKIIEKMKNGVYDLKKMEQNNANYERFGGKFNLAEYYISHNNKAFMDTSLIEKVQFLEFDILKENLPVKVNFVNFRNIMIYYNRLLQNQVLKSIQHSLDSGGFLALGIKETLNETLVNLNFVKFNDEEKIYKKI